MQRYNGRPHEMTSQPPKLSLCQEPDSKFKCGLLPRSSIPETHSIVLSIRVSRTARERYLPRTSFMYDGLKCSIRPPYINQCYSPRILKHMNTKQPICTIDGLLPTPHRTACTLLTNPVKPVSKHESA